MDTTTKAFFEGLDGRHDPALEKANGTIRFDLKEDGRIERWFVAIDGGDISVSRRNAAAACVVRASGSTFASLARGKANAMAAVLRGALMVEGDLELLVRFQRLLPSPPPTRIAREAEA